MKGGGKFKLSRHKVLLITVILTVSFFSIISQTLVTSALPAITNEMHIDASVGQWLTTAFTLILAIMVTVTAFLMGRYNTRTLFETSILIFLVGCLLAGWSPSFTILMIGRILQACGAGILMPLAQTTILMMMPFEHRGAAMGLVGLVLAFAPSLGPTVAGLVVDYYNWHMLWWALAICMAVMAVIGAFVFEDMSLHKSGSLDKLSVLLSSLGFGGLLYGFGLVGSYGIHIKAILAVALGVCALILFFSRQLKLDQPMLDVRVFKHRNFTIGVTICMIVQAALLSGTLIIPIYVQTLRGFSATISGLVLLPGALATGILSPISGRIFDKHGPRVVAVTGMIFLSIGSFGLIFIGRDVTMVMLAVIYIIRCIGQGIVNMPMNTWALNALDNSLLPHGTAVSNTFRQVAGSLGTALMVTVMSMTQSKMLDAGKAEALLHGIRAAFIFAAIIVVCGFILVLLEVKENMNAHNINK